MIAKGDCPHKRIPPYNRYTYTHSANLPEPLLKKKPRTTYIYTFSPSVRLPQMSNRWHREKIFHVGNFYCGAALHCSIVTPTKFLEATTASSHNAPSSFILASSRMMAFYHDNFSSCLQLWCCYVVQGAGAIPTRPPLNINSNSSWM